MNGDRDEEKNTSSILTALSTLSPPTVCVVDCVMVWVCTQALSIYRAMCWF